MKKKKNAPRASVEALKPASNSYESFIRDLTLIGIGMKSCNAEVDSDAYFEALKDEDSHRRVLSSESGIADLGENYFELASTINLEATGKGGKKLLQIESTYVLHFHAKAVDKGFIERFAKAELRVIIWPYFRQFVTDMSARMSIPPITIPLSTGSGT